MCIAFLTLMVYVLNGVHRSAHGFIMLFVYFCHAPGICLLRVTWITVGSLAFKALSLLCHCIMRQSQIQGQDLQMTFNPMCGIFE